MPSLRNSTDGLKVNFICKKRNPLFGGIAKGSYSTLETKSLQEVQFSFQQRTVLRQQSDVDAGKCRPNYRIIVGDNPFWEIAYSNDKLSLEANEWQYVQALFVPTSWKETTRKWVLSHFRQMCPTSADEDAEDEVESTSEPLPSDYNGDEKEGVAASSAVEANDKATSSSDNGNDGEGKASAGSACTMASSASPNSGGDNSNGSDVEKTHSSNQNDSDREKTASGSRPRRVSFSTNRNRPTNLRARSDSRGSVLIHTPSIDIPTDGVTINSFEKYWQAALAVNVLCLLLRQGEWYAFGLALIVVNIFMHRLYSQLPRTVYVAGPPVRNAASPINIRKRDSIRSKQSAPLASGHSAIAAHPPLPSPDTDPAPPPSQVANPPSTDTVRNLADLVAGESVPFSEDGGVETAPRISWSQTNVDFLVRQKGNKKRKKKASSAPAFYDCVGVDLLSSKKKICHIFSKMKIPDTLKREVVCGVPTVFVMNFQMPSYIKLRSPYDGEGYSFVLYFVMNDRGREQLQNNLCPAAVLLKEFIANWKPIMGNYHRRLKCITTVANPSNLSLGAFLSSMLKQYDAVPFLTGPKYHTFHEGYGYLEVDVDIHRFIFLARQVCCQAVDVVTNMVVDVAFCVQGESDEELPEQVLGSVRLNRLNPRLAQRVTQLNNV